MCVYTYNIFMCPKLKQLLIRENLREGGPYMSSFENKIPKSIIFKSWLLAPSMDHTQIQNQQSDCQFKAAEWTS